MNGGGVKLTPPPRKKLSSKSPTLLGLTGFSVTEEDLLIEELRELPLDYKRVAKNIVGHGRCYWKKVRILKYS